MPNSSGDTGHNLLRAHALMRRTGEVPAGQVPAVIASSWRRCLDGGLGWERVPDFSPLSRDGLETRREQNVMLVTHALPVMENLYEQIANTQSMVVLSDASGYILHSLGDDDFLARAQRVALAPGVEWSETSKGTNAIGTALAERSPVVVHGAQHYLPVNHFLTCSAAPILDPYGELVGVLDVTGDRRSFSPHTLALANMSVQMIENHLFTHAFADAIVFRFHARPEFLGTLCEGLAAFAPDGQMLSVNRSGCFQLGLSPRALRALPFDALFAMPFGAAIRLAQQGAPAGVPLLLPNGIRVFARLVSDGKARQAQPVPRAAAAQEAEFFARDARLSDLAQQAARALEAGVPLLLQGETGCGKAELARWLHAGRQKAGPWVEINCGAVGAEELDRVLLRCRRHRLGDPCRNALLFLRDVDRLDPALQAKLLSGLQAGLPLHPLAGSAPALVSSTRAKLKDLVARGLFRADLYYRLGGLPLSLPPLRQRQDRWELAEHLAARLGIDSAAIRLDGALRPLFESHPWPGNVRQLVHVLRSAAASSGGSDLTPAHLPEDFVHELDSAADDAGHAVSGDLDAITRQAMEAALHAHGGNVSAAARHLGVSRSTLYRRLREG